MWVQLGTLRNRYCIPEVSLAREKQMYRHHRCHTEPSAGSEVTVRLIGLLDRIFTHFVLYLLPVFLRT